MEHAIEEKTVWQGSSSQITNLGTFIFCFLFCWLIFPIVIALVRYLKVKCLRYELTTERLRISRGILSKTLDELELYRVKDTEVYQPFFYRLLGLGNVTLLTADHTDPYVLIEAVPNCLDLRNQIRNYVEKCRERKRVRSVDVEP